MKNGKLIEALEAIKTEINNAVAKYDEKQDLNELLATLSAGIFSISLILQAFIIQETENE